MADPPQKPFHEFTNVCTFYSTESFFKDLPTYLPISYLPAPCGQLTAQNQLTVSFQEIHIFIMI